MIYNANLETKHQGVAEYRVPVFQDENSPTDLLHSVILLNCTFKNG